MGSKQQKKKRKQAHEIQSKPLHKKKIQHAWQNQAEPLRDPAIQFLKFKLTKLGEPKEQELLLNLKIFVANFPF